MRGLGWHHCPTNWTTASNFPPQDSLFCEKNELYFFNPLLGLLLFAAEYREIFTSSGHTMLGISYNLNIKVVFY